MAQRSTLLLVHGAWSGGWPWEPVLDPLLQRGVCVEVIEQLPSAGVDADELGDLRADAAHVRERLSEIAAPVVICGHSYGGMVITECADHPAIMHSVYLTAFWPGPGQSLLDLVGGQPPDWIVDHGDGSLTVTDDVERARQALFTDLDPDRAAKAHARLVPQSAASFATPSSAPARSHPTTYVFCTEDQAIPLTVQEAMSAGADNVVWLRSAHFAQLSCPETLADALAAVVVGDYEG
jgi:pimeloyl-ACP methyl ester carboxylesterase